MKGITHFLSGVAVASCFPLAVESIFHSKTLLLPLGGAFGILPDTLDFRVARYTWDYQKVVSIDENNLDPKIVAETVAAAIDEAAATGETVTLRLNIIKISSSYYRTYNVYIDDETKEVTAIIGPIKTISQVMEKHEYMPPSRVVRKSIKEHGIAKTYAELFEVVPGLPESAPSVDNYYTAKYTADIQNTYYHETEVGIFSGPDYAFVPKKDKVRIDFIPWHRRWAHCLPVGVLMGAIAFLLFASWGELSNENFAGFANPYAITAFFIAVLAFWLHIFEDQLGHLGSNLLYPFTKDRSIGMKLTTAASPVSNTITNWIALAVIVWNLNAYAPTAAFTMPWADSIAGGFADWTYYLVSLANYSVFVLILPLCAYLLCKRFWGRYNDKDSDGIEEGFDSSYYAGDQSDS